MEREPPKNEANYISVWSLLCSLKLQEWAPHSLDGWIKSIVSLHTLSIMPAWLPEFKDCSGDNFVICVYYLISCVDWDEQAWGTIVSIGGPLGWTTDSNSKRDRNKSNFAGCGQNVKSSKSVEAWQDYSYKQSTSKLHVTNVDLLGEYGHCGMRVSKL